MDTKKNSKKSSLDTQLLELISLRIGQINNCDYSVNMHFNELKHMGENELRLSLLCVWDVVPYFSEKEKMVFRLTEYLTLKNTNKPTNEIYNMLLFHFKDEEIHALTQAIVKINVWTWTMKTHGFRSENE